LFSEWTSLQVLPEMRVQGIQVNVFHRQPIGAAVRAILAAAAFGLAHALPIGRPVTTAGEAVMLDKGFQQINGVAVLTLPITADTPGDATQHVAGQRGHTRPRHDQKARIVRKQMQVMATGSSVPADILIPVGTLPSWRTKEHAG
jgi:hypothetical protein